MIRGLPWRRRLVPLRERLLRLAAAAILPVATMSGIALAALWLQQREQAGRLGLEITRALSIAEDAELRRTIAVLEGIAASPSLDRADLRRYHGLTERILDNRPDWLTITLADPGGRVLLNARVPYGGRLPPLIERESFDEVLRAGAPAVGALARGPQGAWAVPVRVPVVRDGTVRYVLTAAVKPDNFLDVLKRQRLPQDWVVSLFDANGRRVARSRQHEEFLGQAPAPSLRKLMRAGGTEGTGISYALEGERVYTAFSRSPSTGWTVAVGIPSALVEAGAWRSLAAYGGGILLSIALAVLAVLAIARRITGPMAGLSAAAQALGRREAVAMPASDVLEIRRVADSLEFAAAERTRSDAERQQLLEREQQARAVAEAANRSKDEFLAMLGHELRNPLGAIANGARLLEAADEATRAHARDVIARQVQHLARMTDDLLDAARAMTGKIVLQRQPLELAQAAARAVAALHASGRAGEHRFVQRLEPAWVDADPTRIEQVLANLLANAVKYTPAGGAITVSVAREGPDAVLCVSDEGIGMPADLVGRVFEPFVQGERSLDRSHGGLGIGLTLVRRLAELHGGSALAESEGAGRGSSFTVRLPAIEAPAQRPARPVAGGAARRLRVLVVEDNADARDTLARLLELEGHRVRAAADGASALALLRGEALDAALIDIGLPGIDGYELARRIRAEIDPGRRLLLAAVTGYGLPEDRRRSAAAGFDAHLIKPIDLAALGALLGGEMPSGR
ncbi:MAG TPA: ATP-binding protein [Burkholderiales bacterium]|nr:ATP-binding protein [Burkholderiales bacterium]